jgi:hypothetical protein
VDNTVTGAQIRHRIEMLVRAQGDENAVDEDVHELLTAGYGYALRLDSQRLRLERRITELAARAEEPEAASELRGLWLRHRTIGAELGELREMLRDLREYSEIP